MNRVPYLRSKQSYDLTRNRYNVRLTATFVNCGQVRFWSPSKLYALDTIALICFSHEIMRVAMIPRTFSSATSDEMTVRNLHLDVLNWML